ncbi:MAG: hypothetical protein GXO78_00635 [Calditrichaeota bacterium]|nr:hypothetical protein [Calditrichota bacterium]
MNIRYGLHIFLFLFLSGLVWISCQRQPSSEDVLARIDRSSITTDDFRKRFQELKVRMGLPDNGQTRRELLKNMVNEKLLIIEAKHRGYDRDAQGQFEWERIQIQGLLNQFYEREIASKVRISERELRELFVRFNTRIKARHLYAPTRKKADSLYALLQKGASFEELAKKVFKDPRLRESGGLIGYFTVDEMHPNFEDAAFRLKVGEISPPVKIASGYSIIKVEDRIQNPLITEIQFAQKKDRLEQFLRYRKTIKKAAAFVDSMRRVLEVEFDPDVIREVYQHIQGQPEGYLILEERGDGFAPELDDRIIVRSRLGEWTVRTFREKARFTSDKEKRWIRNEENLEEFIAGLVVRDYMLQQARRKKYDRLPEYREYVQEQWEMYLLERLEQALWEEIVVPEDSLRHYYQRNRDRFTQAPQIGLREIAVNDRQVAQVIKRLLRQGASFEELAQKYSIRNQGPTRANDVAYFTRRQLGKWADEIFPLQPGEWRGPFTSPDSLYLFVKCVDRLPQRVIPYEEAREEIVKIYKYMWMAKKREEIIRRVERTVPVARFPEKLKTVRLN